MPEEIFDFGFTAVDHDPDEVTKEIRKARDYRKAFEKLWKDVDHFLTNLEKNPEKAYIHWPNRVEKIEQFRKRILEYDPNY